MNPEKAYKQLELLRRLIIETNRGFVLQELLQNVIVTTCNITELQAGYISIWKGTETLTKVWSGSDSDRKLLELIEADLLSRLWKGYQVQSLYLNLEHDGARSVFSYPVKKGTEIAGAISGICAGPRNLTLEEEFIDTISNQIGIALSKQEGFPADASTPAQVAEKVKSARLNAILETAAALNHEVNNPLTAVLGNAQLLLLLADKLSPEVVEKLKAIEESALRIREVTSRLMKIIEPVTVEYASGLKMIDIHKSKTKKDSEEKQ
ncbi:MAG: hypothetical protein L0Y74_02035 [candidate division Zixibacteria bacterium]|nr:hypothetical protein [candidate division Zixibacteria bacterium]